MEYAVLKSLYNYFKALENGVVAITPLKTRGLIVRIDYQATLQLLSIGPIPPACGW